MWLRAHHPNGPRRRRAPQFLPPSFRQPEFEAQGSNDISLTGGAGGEENSEIPETFMFEWMSRVGGRQPCHDKATAER